MRPILIVATATALACHPAAVNGEIGGVPFDGGRTAYFGGPFILIADQAIDCNQMGWVQRTYNEGAAADGRRSFVALQIAFSSGEIEQGNYLADRAQGITVDGLVNTGDDVQIHHAREGTVDLTTVTASRVEGTFSVAFGTGGVAGEFSAEPCVNLRP